MTYLNDDFEGGKTTFNHYDLDIKPVTGRTMIWPAEIKVKLSLKAQNI